MSVETLINDARGYAANLAAKADSALDDANTRVLAVGYIVPNPVHVDFPSAPPSSIDLTLPVFDVINLDLPAEPGAAPEFQDIGTVEVGALPVLTAAAPTLVMPTLPSQIAPFTQSAPSINTSIAFPEPPDQLLYPTFDAPVLADRQEPAKPNVMLPSFDALQPTGIPSAPTDLAASFDDAYRNAAPSTVTMLNGYVDDFIAKHDPGYFTRMEKVQAQLDRYLAGGTGFSPAVEDAIYSRARGKNDAETRRARDSALQDAAARGFTMPPGAALAIIRGARQAGADNNARAATDIAIKQAEIEQANLQFVVTTSAGLRATMLNAALSYHQNLMGINSQALDYAKSVLSSIIETYNTAVRIYSLKLDGYRAEASVYETRLKAAMAGIELYQVEIQALTALTNVDKARVDVYRARLEGLNSLANVYRAQIDAVTGRVSLEKLKLEVFQAQAQAYATVVQGKNAEYQGYSAAIEGQSAIAKIYATRVDAYQAELGGYKAGIEAKTAAVQAAALTNKSRAENYGATISGYSSVVQARGEVARTQLEGQRQQLQAFTAQAQAVEANARVMLEFYRVTSSTAIENARMDLAAQVQQSESTREFGKALASLGQSTAQVYSGVASSALAGMNSLASQNQNL